jgi:phosphoglycolate phosphatase-like HAD superfamily hydrolase
MTTKHVRQVIFDLDRTLWRATVEYHPRMARPPPVFPGTHQMLRTFVDTNTRLHVASRSSDETKCHIFLRRLFPDIPFHTICIWPTSTPTKRSHVSRILRRSPGRFAMVDDERHILDDICRHHPRCVPLQRVYDATWDTVLAPLRVSGAVRSTLVRPNPEEWLGTTGN